MKKLFTFLLYAMMIIAVGCTESFDDSKIWDKLNSLENRVEALEQLCRQMNTNISSLQTVVNALQNNDYVTNIAPITEDGKVIGYTITFSKSGAVTIYHGKDGKDGTDGANGADGADGKDGYTPVIGVAKDSDGIYYWTLDGDWLLDKDGNKIKAEGRDGKDGQDGENGKDGQDGVNGADGQDGANGKDGITPKLKIENGYWHISYDDGATWTELGKATGEDGADGKDGQDGADGKDGDSMFKDVTYDDENVYITLTDGSVLEIPRHTIQNNEIWYTSSDGKIVTPDPFNRNSFGVNILSNEYKNGRGVITFDGNITTIGEMAFFLCKTLTSVTIPKSVTVIRGGAFKGCSALTEITIPDGVTEIGDGAFSDTAITNISIPESVTSIGISAFNGCSALTEITIPDSVTSIGNYAFIGCSALTEITIPDSVTSIGDGAFERCTSLTEINIPDGVTAIGNNAFRSCSTLTEINIPDGVTEIGGYAFSGCSALTEINIPNGVTVIREGAFKGCSALTEVTIPDGVTTIESNAFNECNSLKSFYGKYATSDNRCLVIDGVLIAFAPAELTSYTIPDNVTVISDYIFQNYSELTSITIPDSVTSIGNYAFISCSALTEITIPNGVTAIRDGAFMNCPALTNITIPESVKEIGTGAFSSCSSLKAFHGKYASADNRCLVINGVLTAFAPAELTTYTTPDNVTEIGEYAFSYCTSLTNINISNGVKSIERDAFSDCSSLTKINIPNSVTEIGVCAFRCCSSLTEITIPESVKTIGWGAFNVVYMNECSLTTIYCKSSTPPTTADGDSMPIPSLQKIYVPTASVDAYKVANGWKNHADKIVGYDFSE